jgi:threonine aldolase
MRKALGGGMRQAGVLAAAGIVALEEMTGRLARDHEHAQLLARGLAAIPGVRLDPSTVRTNIVYFDLDPEVPLSAPQIARRLREEVRVWVGAESERQFRVLTHYWVGPNEIEILLAGLRDIMRQPDIGN